MTKPCERAACPTTQDMSLCTSPAESPARTDPQRRLVARGMGGHKVKDRGMWCTSQRPCTSTGEELSVQHQVNARTLFNIKLRGLAQYTGTWIER